MRHGRDTEKRLQEELEKAKGEWEEESKHKRFPIGEEDIAEVVSMMTGIPVSCLKRSSKPFNI